MQDEQFMRSWNDNHHRFAAEIDHGFEHVIDRISRRRARRKGIGNPYGIPDKVDGPALTPGARASLRGLAASVLTVTLWVVVMMLATPAPGLAAAPGMANVECVIHPYLA